MIRFVRKIIIPYIEETRQKLGDPDQTALVLFDVFSGQTTNRVHEALECSSVSVAWYVSLAMLLLAIAG